MAMTVKKLVEGHPVHSVGEHDTVLSAVRRMVENNIGAVAVVRSDELVGMVSERDLMKRVVAQGRDPNKTTMGEVMTTGITAVTPDAPVEGAMLLMKQGGFRHLPITQGRKIIGMISLRDLLWHTVNEQDYELEMFRDYIAKAS